MNNTGIEWTQFTANPIRGKCPHFGTPSCGIYCYAKRRNPNWSKAPFFVPAVLDEIKKRKKPAVIFVGSVIDIWADAIPDEWVKEIYGVALATMQHTIVFCSKNPSRYYLAEIYRRGIWFGASTPDANKTATFCDTLSILRGRGARTFISAEPLIEPIAKYLDTDAFDGIIIGAMTGPGAVKPEKQWITDIIDVSAGKAIFLKDNMLELFPELPRLRETAWKR
jgi:protein gp37